MKPQEKLDCICRMITIVQKRILESLNAIEKLPKTDSLHKWYLDYLKDNIYIQKRLVNYYNNNLKLQH